MKIIRLENLGKEDYQRITRRSSGLNLKIRAEVERIMEKIKQGGDRIIMEKYQSRYGKKNYKTIKVSPDEIKEAYRNTDVDLIRSFRQMVKNITAVHRVQLKEKKDRTVKPEYGIEVWREWRPIEKVGVYIPGGKAIYPSSVFMSTIPAKIAGCSEIVICSPPDKNGKIPVSTLAAADMAGIKNIFKVGGAEAIAAMAYGTESIPKVYKIFGAGNSYVTLAKQIALESVAIDMPAGPSEVLIIADETGNPSYIAADLLADGEHGEDSACVLITVSEKIALETKVEINRQLRKLSTGSRAKAAIKQFGLIAVTSDLNKAIDFANEYAPEHLEVMTRNPEKIIYRIKNAGSVFLGNYTSKSSGDYATGANHVLPTGGMARMYAPLGVDAFGKWMQVQRCTKSGLAKIRKAIEIVADIEQLPAHRNATSIRFI